MLEDNLGRVLCDFQTPNQGLLDIGDKLFIYESGVRIGIGTLVAQSDDFMLVAVEFTDLPRLQDANGGHFLSCGLISDAANMGDGQ